PFKFSLRVVDQQVIQRKRFREKIDLPNLPSFSLVLVDRWLVSRLNIACASCGHTWTVSHLFSLYEQQAVESCPCPGCGAYTLCCQEETTTSVAEQPRRS